MTRTSLTEAFYLPPNEIDPSQVEGAAGELLRYLLSRLQSHTTRTLLPARIGGATRWYGLAPSDREARLLREEVRSWLGPPISARTINIENSSDPLDRQALRLVPAGAVLRVDVADGWQADAHSNVASLTDLWALAPERGVDQPRPVGRVLRQFYESLLAGDRALAEAGLDEIKSRALLNSTNIRFLRVKLLSTLGSPHEIRDDPTLRGISLLARPPAVTEQLAAAANALLVQPALTDRRSAADWAVIAEQLEDAWPSLVTHRQQVTSPSTARCFALRELLADKPRESLLSELAEQFPNDPVLSTATPTRVANIAPSQPSTTALGLYHEGDYWAALLATETVPPGRASASVALAAAVNLGDSASAVRALAVFDRLPGDDRDQLLGTAVERAFYERLLASTSNAQVPDGWLAWLRGDWSDRPDLLAEWARLWPRIPEVLQQDADPLAGELLDALNDTRRARVRNGLPIFVEWLVQDGLQPSGVSLATTIFDILLSSEPGRIERQAALVLLDETLSIGCSAQEYVELADAVSRQLPMLGPRDAAWLAQCLDLFLLFTSRDVTRRESLFSYAGGVARSWRERLDATDSALLRYIFADAGIDFTVPEASDKRESDTTTTRPFRSVGIYSLLESAVRVASKWIKDMWPNVEIRASSGHVNSESLAALVKASDVILVQTSHAKHAATQAIDTMSSDPSRLVLVHGRGATSLVRALLAWHQGAPTNK
jgi:hypothetical protein